MRLNKFKITLILLSTFYVNFLSAQQIKTTFVAEKNGLLDSIEIGFDLTASIDIDSQFGEIDLTDTPFDSIFEIRAGQINLNYLECELDQIDPNNELITYQSKVDIFPRDCDDWDSNQTINGTFPFSTIFVRNKDLPIVLRWDSSMFSTPCLGSSRITDWNPGVWFDVGPCDELSVNPFFLSSRDSILITEPSDQLHIDSFQDTLSMFFIALGGKILSDKNIELQEESIRVYPNPTSDIVIIESEELNIQTVEIFNSIGQFVKTLYDPNKVDLQDHPDGIYYLKIKTKNSSFVEEIVLQRN